MSGSSTDSSMASDICSQIQTVFSFSSSPSPLDVLLRELSTAAASSSKIFVHGVGREGLMLRGLCMRLCHLGLPAHAVGDVTAPPIASSDLLLSSAGPGGFSTVDAIAGVAKSAGARVVLLTARPGAGRGASSVADAVVHLPARTMADREEEGEEEGLRLPMGSLFEGAMFVLFEMVVLKLAELLGQSPTQMRSRHTNLE